MIFKKCLNKFKSDDSGFTLIELLLAMTLFSTVMVIATIGFIAMNRGFTRGVIRKELSEATQIANEDITRSVRSEGINSVPTICTGTEGGCPKDWNAICFSSVRYFWQSTGAGMYKDSEACGKPIQSLQDKYNVVDDRFKVQAFTVSKLTAVAPDSEPVSSALYSVLGLFSTKDDAALTSPSDGDPFKKTCKGTAQNSAVNSCAVEKFEFIISARNLDA